MRTYYKCLKHSMLKERLYRAVQSLDINHPKVLALSKKVDKLSSELMEEGVFINIGTN